MPNTNIEPNSHDPVPFSSLGSRTDGSKPKNMAIAIRTADTDHHGDVGDVVKQFTHATSWTR